MRFLWSMGRTGVRFPPPPPSFRCAAAKRCPGVAFAAQQRKDARRSCRREAARSRARTYLSPANAASWCPGVAQPAPAGRRSRTNSTLSPARAAQRCPGVVQPPACGRIFQGQATRMRQDRIMFACRMYAAQPILVTGQSPVSRRLGGGCSTPHLCPGRTAFRVRAPASPAVRAYTYAWRIDDGQAHAFILELGVTTCLTETAVQVESIPSRLHDSRRLSWHLHLARHYPLDYPLKRVLPLFPDGSRSTA